MIHQRPFPFINLLVLSMLLTQCRDSGNVPDFSGGNFSEHPLTFNEYGHTIHHIQAISPDNQWVVYDTRNADSMIGSTGRIEMVNINTREVVLLYATTHQSSYGPGVGAVTFSPVTDTVIFIHGINNASESNPYGFTRRTGVAVDAGEPERSFHMDARNIVAPFTPGALRGGTHAHSWSGDGKWISFTYNDEVIRKLSEKDTGITDLRTIGVMVPGEVLVSEKDTMENFSGHMFSVVVAEVTAQPVWGSDQVEKAFDECWIGKNGYINEKGVRQPKAIAFQGNVRDEQGKLKTEVFVCDLPDDLTIARPGKPLQGTPSTRPNVPAGVSQRRVTYTQAGIEGPRHWLRSSPDGNLIAFLAKDSSGLIQLYAVSPKGGNIKKITANPFSVQGPFNFSPDGNYIAYMADNSVFVSSISTSIAYRLTKKADDAEKPMGAPVWSNDGSFLVYHKYVQGYLQVFLLRQDNGEK